jgi:hypothetical protein
MWSSTENSTGISASPGGPSLLVRLPAVRLRLPLPLPTKMRIQTTTLLALAVLARSSCVVGHPFESDADMDDSATYAEKHMARELPVAYLDCHCPYER